MITRITVEHTNGNTDEYTYQDRTAAILAAAELALKVDADIPDTIVDATQFESDGLLFVLREFPLPDTADYGSYLVATITLHDAV